MGWMMKGAPLSSLGGWALAEGAGGRGALVEGVSQQRPQMD